MSFKTISIEALNVPLVRVGLICIAVWGAALWIERDRGEVNRMQENLEGVRSEQWTVTHHYLYETTLRYNNPQLVVPTTAEIDRLYQQLKRNRERQP